MKIKYRIESGRVEETEVKFVTSYPTKRNGGPLFERIASEVSNLKGHYDSAFFKKYIKGEKGLDVEILSEDGQDVLCVVRVVYKAEYICGAMSKTK